MRFPRFRRREVSPGILGAEFGQRIAPVDAHATLGTECFDNSGAFGQDRLPPERFHSAVGDEGADQGPAGYLCEGDLGRSILLPVDPPDQREQEH